MERDIEDVLRSLVADLESMKYRLPRDIDTVRWAVEQLLHWLETEAGAALATAAEGTRSVREALSGVEGMPEADLRSVAEALDAVDRAGSRLARLLGIDRNSPADEDAPGGTMDPETERT